MTNSRRKALIFLGVGLALFLFSARPWRPAQMRVVQAVLSGMVTGRNCSAMFGLVDGSRIRCTDRNEGPAIISRDTGAEISTQQVYGVDTFILGPPLQILRRHESRMWIYQEGLDVTFFVDDRLLVDFGRGKLTSEEPFASFHD